MRSTLVTSAAVALLTASGALVVSCFTPPDDLRTWCGHHLDLCSDAGTETGDDGGSDSGSDSGTPPDSGMPPDSGTVDGDGGVVLTWTLGLLGGTAPQLTCSVDCMVFYLDGGSLFQRLPPSGNGLAADDAGIPVGVSGVDIFAISQSGSSYVAYAANTDAGFALRLLSTSKSVVPTYRPVDVSVTEPVEAVSAASFATSNFAVYESGRSDAGTNRFGWAWTLDAWNASVPADAGLVSLPLPAGDDHYPSVVNPIIPPDPSNSALPFSYVRGTGPGSSVVVTTIDVRGNTDGGVLVSFSPSGGVGPPKPFVLCQYQPDGGHNDEWRVVFRTANGMSMGLPDGGLVALGPAAPAAVPAASTDDVGRAVVAWETDAGIIALRQIDKVRIGELSLGPPGTRPSVAVRDVYQGSGANEYYLAWEDAGVLHVGKLFLAP